MACDLRLRNYSVVETDTPTPLAPSATPLPGNTPAPTATLTPTITPVPPTPTALPPNPIQLTEPDLLYNLIKGAFVVIAAFALLGLFFALRRFFQK